MDTNQKRFLLIAGGATVLLIVGLYIWNKTQGAAAAQNTVTPAVVDQTQLDNAVADALANAQATSSPAAPTPAPGPVTGPYEPNLGPHTPTPTPAPHPTPAPPPVPRPPTTNTTVTHYVVKSGDTLWAIAKRFYGNGALYPTIYNANRTVIKNPDRIYPGEVLTIPARA